MKTLLLRADAGGRVGTGHLLRCLALAQAWQDRGGHAVFLSRCEVPALAERIAKEGFELVEVREPHPAPTDLDVLLKTAASGPGGTAFVAVDGYHFDAAFCKALRAAGHRLLVIDDVADQPYYEADVLLNQNLGAETLDYHASPQTRLLLGPQFALLRPEFALAAGSAPEQRVAPRASRVLVTMGGSDPTNATSRVLRDLAGVAGPLEIRVLVGAGAAFLDLGQTTGSHRITRLRDPRDVSEHILWADLVVAAAGTTSWEVACLGRPALLGVVAENQRGIAAELHAAGAAVDLGWLSDLGPNALAAQVQGLVDDMPRRAAMASAGRRLVDGHGARRVVAVLHSWSSKE